MNNLYRIFVLMFTAVIFITSCSEKQSNKNQTVKITTDTLNSNSEINVDTFTTKLKTDTLVESKKKIKKKTIIYKYICPLGCKEGNSNTKGNCPNCGMELIENPDYITKKQTNK
ncbi:MAG: hypothetical protein L3J56_03985 [Bacteroidales bacterium]|nr:hypothetical protein [Bacteroidales bacterium]